MSSQTVSLNLAMENFLQKASPELKILFILYFHDKIRHSEIYRLSHLYPGIDRKSSRTFYKIYQRLISEGLIKKTKDFLIHRQYYAYTLTPEGKKYIEFLLQLPTDEELISYSDFKYIYSTQESQSPSISAKNAEDPGTKPIINFLIEEIKDLKSQLRRFPAQSELNSNMSDYSAKYSWEDDNVLESEEIIPESSVIASGDLLNGDLNSSGQLDKDLNDADALENLNSNENTNLNQNSDQIDGFTASPNSKTLESIEPTEPPKPPKPSEPPFITHLKSLSQDEVLTEIPSIFLDPAKWLFFVDYFHKLEYKGGFNLQIFEKIFLSMKENKDFVSLKASLTQLINDLDFTFNEVNEIFIKFPFPVIVQIFTDYLLFNFSPAEWENINVSYGSGKISIIQFLHQILRYYFTQKRYQACWDLIQEIRRKYSRIGEIAVQYEISILIRQVEYDRAIQLIKTELFDRERQVGEQKTWYYIFRAFYDAQRLPEFINLQYNGDNREFYYNWSKLAELVIQIKKGPDYIPNFFRIKTILRNFLPIFDNVDITNVSERYISELKKYPDVKDINRVYYYFHLAPIIYQIFKNPVVLGLPPDYDANDLLQICVQPQNLELYDDFPSVLYEIQNLSGIETN